MTAKQEIRNRCIEARKALSPGDAALKSAAICSRLRELPDFRDASTVLTYVASKDNEVDTRPVIEWLLAADRKVFVPIAEVGRTLVWSELRSLSELGVGRFGILEPLAEFRRPVAPGEGAVVLVPGIAFTKAGDRIGYGGGYFDRFLRDFRGVKIALAYDVQVVEAIPSETHDVCMDVVVTESDVFGADLNAGSAS